MLGNDIKAIVCIDAVIVFELVVASAIRILTKAAKPKVARTEVREIRVS